MPPSEVLPADIERARVWLESWEIEIEQTNVLLSLAAEFAKVREEAIKAERFSLA